MANMDAYNYFSIACRIIALLLLAYVAGIQMSELQSRELFKLKQLLLGLIIIIIFGNVLALTINFFRAADGNLLTNVRHISQVFNGIAAVATGTLLTLIYKYKE